MPHARDVIDEGDLRRLSRRADAAQARMDQPPPLARCRRCLIDCLPAAVVVLVVAGLIAWALTGCAARQEAGYTTRDDLRVACGTAARAYGVAIERTRAGEMSRETFAAIDNGYAGVVETCRRVLAEGQPAAAGDAAGIAAWSASVEALP